MSFPQFASWNIRGFNNPSKVRACKDLVNSHKLKLICILEARIHSSTLLDPWFVNMHRIYENEGSCNNFNISSPGRIWLKWDASSVTFSPHYASPQMIHGTFYFGSTSILISVIYAANSVDSRKSLWEDLRRMIPSSPMPWVVLGDLNCCRYADDKAGGTAIPMDRLGELNNIIFDCGLMDLSSVGLHYTWFNQRPELPIHIKLDRTLINDVFLEYFPAAFYKVLPPSCSDHSPLLLIPKALSFKPSRFLFKNYWMNMEGFWEEVLSAFACQHNSSPVSAFYCCLQNLKNALKNKNWSSSTFLSNSICDLKDKQRGSIIPKGCQKIINRLCSRFLYHANSSDRKLHLISWANTTLPKRYGGLNIPSIEALYHGVFSSIICRMYSNDSLLGLWLKGKYISPWKPPSNSASKFWKGICNTARLIKNNISFGISKDSKLPMFWIPWCYGKTLAELLNRESLGSQDISVYLSDEGWELPTFVPSDIAEIIHSVLILESEIFAWEGSSNFQFNFFMTQFYTGLREVTWHNFVWFKNNALRLSAYTWMAVLGKLKTADVLLSRAIPVNLECSFCMQAPESHKHLFFECEYSYNVLTDLLPELGAFLLRPNIFQAFEFLDNTIFSDKNFGFLTITVVIYYLWMERNSRRFSNSWNSPEQICNLISKALKLKTRKWKHLNEISRRFPRIFH
ncbi:hypothetical protein M5K25_025651 [Dendrobium thyrsiflorum]|uniref:Reverse transcriptase zinc-binding domain-containing protein n=1 Tax=Dendrobium thyrsiflorum TaxID=117978 RepID=A0ABD0UA87_DENTH